MAALVAGLASAQNRAASGEIILGMSAAFTGASGQLGIELYRGAEKQRLRADDLLNRFEDVRRAEQLDESAAEMLQRLYV